MVSTGPFLAVVCWWRWFVDGGGCGGGGGDGCILYCRCKLVIMFVTHNYYSRHNRDKTDLWSRRRTTVCWRTSTACILSSRTLRSCPCQTSTPREPRTHCSQWTLPSCCHGCPAGWRLPKKSFSKIAKWQRKIKTRHRTGTINLYLQWD